MFKSLVAKPHGDGEGTSPMVAKNDDGLVGIEFLVSAGWDVSHRHQNGLRKGGGADFPRFPDV
jgi:hypothetical protein